MTKFLNLVLVGFMGTGKTAVGRILAARLHRSFVEMDEQIAAKSGQSISDIFATQGEMAFRRMEREWVIEQSGISGRVIATGGGVILDPANMEDLQRTGLVVCLTASKETLLARLQGDHSRPLLEGDQAVRLSELMDARRSLYEAIPIRIDTTGMSPEAVAEEVLRLTSD